MHTRSARRSSHLVRHVLRRGAGVDQLEVGLRVLHHGASHKATDAAEAVDAGVHRHGQLGRGCRGLAGHGRAVEGAGHHEGGGGPGEGHGSGGVKDGSHVYNLVGSGGYRGWRSRSAAMRMQNERTRNAQG